MSRLTSVGGQAVIEGVMMRGLNGIATAVRKSDGKIVVCREDSVPCNKKNKLFSLPIIRGFVGLLESMIIGIKTIDYSASFFEDEEVGSGKVDMWLNKIFKDRTDDIMLGLTIFISFFIAMLIFFLFPTFTANVFRKFNIENVVLLNLIEGIIRVTIFLVYICIIGRMSDIRRLFEYHGAEHKTIFCYENEVELTPENAKKFGRLHPRCGTNFIFLVMIVSIVIFSFTGWEDIWERLIYRLVMFPLVSGITYELIKWLGKSRSGLSKILSYPGLMLQKLTTREPDYDQLEVAIAALKSAQGIDCDKK